MNANAIVRHCSSTLHFVAALNFLIKNIAKAGDGIRSTHSVCAQICSYSNFTFVRSYIQILNHGNICCHGHKP